MNPEINLQLAYRVTKLIDLQTPHQEIAASTGLTEDDVREIEAWARDAPDLSAQPQGTITATEALVLQIFCHLAGNTPPTKMMVEAYGAELIQSLGEGLVSTVGDEYLVNFPSIRDEDPDDEHPDPLELEDGMESLGRKGVLQSLIRTKFPDILSEEHDEEPDPQKLETDLLDPRAWEGPPSRLLTELLEQEQEQSDDQERPNDTTLYYILRKDTLRILMETGEFMAILDRIMEEEPTGVKEDARWPHSGPIYIELTEASPEMPEGYSGFVHSFIITEDYGDDIRTVMIPNNLEDGPGTIGVGLNIKTGDIIGIFGPEAKWERAIKLVRHIVTFLTDENNEFVEMPLSRSQRRRLQRSGQPNPWHLVRHRGREDAQRGDDPGTMLGKG